MVGRRLVDDAASSPSSSLPLPSLLYLNQHLPSPSLPLSFLSSLMPLDAACQQVISALGALQAGADRASQLQANDWLTSFQHSVSARRLFRPLGDMLTDSLLTLTLVIVQREAWQTCHSLLFSDEVGLDVKMFAGQTFRAKVSKVKGVKDIRGVAGIEL